MTSVSPPPAPPVDEAPPAEGEGPLARLLQRTAAAAQAAHAASVPF